MKNMRALVLAALLAIPSDVLAQEYVWDTPLSEYGRRGDTVTFGAGDAKEANSAIHTADPRPPHSRNRNIPGSGERMSRTIRRYQDVTKLQEAAPPLAPVSGVSGSSGASSGSSSSGK